MSYDFELFHIPAGEDPTEAYKKHIKEREAGGIAGIQSVDTNELEVVDEFKEERKARIASALISTYPALELFKPDYRKLALSRSISLGEAHQRFNYLELTDHDLGLQVTLFDETAAVAIPFARLEGESAERMLRSVWGCLQLLESEGGFATYDMQQGKILDLDADFHLVLNGYAGAAHTVEKTLRKPWWQFW